jgi:hypothetical protein
MPRTGRHIVVAAVLTPLLLVGLTSCFRGGEGVYLGVDQWVDYEGDHIDVVKKCARMISGDDLPGPPITNYLGWQSSLVTVEQSEKNKYWFTVQGTLDVFTNGSSYPKIEWVCYASQWGTAGEILSYELVE